MRKDVFGSPRKRRDAGGRAGDAAAQPPWTSGCHERVNPSGAWSAIRAPCRR